MTEKEMKFVRIDRELHRKAKIEACKNEITLQEWIQERIIDALNNSKISGGNTS